MSVEINNEQAVEQRPVLEAAIDTYMRLLPEMLKEHEGQWVVIKDGEERPLGFSKSEARLYERGLEAYGKGTFVLMQVSKEYLEFGRYGRPRVAYNSIQENPMREHGDAVPAGRQELNVDMSSSETKRNPGREAVGGCH